MDDFFSSEWVKPWYPTFKALTISPFFFLASTCSFRVCQLMLVDAGRGQEALELEETLLGYLRDDDARRHDVLEGDKAQTLVSAAKCVLCLFALSLLASSCRCR